MCVGRGPYGQDCGPCEGVPGLECHAEEFDRIPRLWGFPMVLERRRDSDPAEVPWERPAKTQPHARPLETCIVDRELEGARLKLGRRVRSAFLGSEDPVPMFPTSPAPWTGSLGLLG